jgi:subtilisin family serine protease
MRGAAFTGLVVGLTLTGCTQKQTSFEPGTSTDQIFSNRPILPRPAIITVHLGNPALLKIGKKTATGWQIPQAAKDALESEQTEFLAQLLALDPNAKVLYHFRFVLNAVTFVGNSNLISPIAKLAGVTSVELGKSFGRPTVVTNSEVTDAGLEGPTSVDFIGAQKAHEKFGVDGTGIRIGIIDTGIDYTHVMLGGRGDASDYKTVKPDQPTPLFPNKKVVGGTDLVGSNYNSASELPIEYIPKPDANPLDEAGHGSHVAGTVAGIGDGIHTYSGVAPGAQLYAIKVFGKTGSTSDAVVIAALEYAADPDGDLNPDDQLDVVNLSLGGDYGAPHILYAEAIKNLSDAGTFVVAAAGNSGSKDNVVGAPGTTDEAISVAASIDGAYANWKYPAVRFELKSGSFLARAVEGPLTKPVSEADGVSGKLVNIGFADAPLTDGIKAAIKGQVALISRGRIPFAAKIKLAADNGAIGVVMMNNVPGDALAMGGEDDGQFKIPGIMVTLENAEKIVTAMNDGDVSITFNTTEKFEDPGRIDTIAAFSSKGPRSEDDLIKPEIAAPGAAVLSAAMGQGTKGVRLDGTSMATPHITGAVALLKQAHKQAYNQAHFQGELTSREVKALMMNNGLSLKDKASKVYPITLQGAGRLQIDAALGATAIATPSLSLGLVESSKPQSFEKTVHVVNLLDQSQTFTIRGEGGDQLQIVVPGSITLGAKESKDFSVLFLVGRVDGTGDGSTNQSDGVEELDGKVVLENEVSRLSIPAMAMRLQTSAVSATLVSDVKTAFVDLTNGGIAKGPALAFNLLGLGTPKHPTPNNEWRSSACAVKSVGYRIVTKKNPDGIDVPFLQFGFQIFDTLTQWYTCELNVQIDTNADGIADFELAGISNQAVAGLTNVEFGSYLLDAGKARDIRASFEKKIRNGMNLPTPSYAQAVLALGEMKIFTPSTIATMEVELSKIGGEAAKRGAEAADLTGSGLSGLADSSGLNKTSTISIKVATLHDDTDNADQPDDFLSRNWQTLSLDPAAQAYLELPEQVDLAPGGHAQMGLGAGAGVGRASLVIYYPYNELGLDSQIL